LFAGCGGTDLGFLGGFSFLKRQYASRRFKIVWANDINSDACETYRRNFGHEIVCADINDVLRMAQNPAIRLPGKADIVLGGFPCQDFSLAGKRRGFKNQNRGLLYQSMVEVVRRLKPKVFVAENVKGLLSVHGGKALEIITNDFARLGYHVVAKLHLVADFGVPQMRERIIIVGTDKKILPPFEHPKTILGRLTWVSLRDALGDLESIEEGVLPNHFWSKAKKNKGQGNSIVNPNRPGPTMRSEHHGNIEWHWNGKRRLSAREAARIQSFPDDFIFYPSTSSAYKQIGNAVPPVMAWHIAGEIQRLLSKYV
jgi:DNA (cytosine-5)-methyltransferase 1